MDDEKRTNVHISGFHRTSFQRDVFYRRTWMSSIPNSLSQWSFPYLWQKDIPPVYSASNWSPRVYKFQVGQLKRHYASLVEISRKQIPAIDRKKKIFLLVNLKKLSNPCKKDIENFKNMYSINNCGFWQATLNKIKYLYVITIT